MIDLGRFRRGDRAYFDEIIRIRGRIVLRVAQAYGRDPDHTEDLFQEIWKRVLEKRTSYKGRGSFEAWLHRLAINTCISEYRRERSRAEALERMRQSEVSEQWSPWDRDPSGDPERRELHLKLHRAMATLSEREHQAIWLRIFDGMTPDEVAEVMGIRKSTVRSTIRNGIKRLREYIEAPEYDLP